MKGKMTDEPRALSDEGVNEDEAANESEGLPLRFELTEEQIEEIADHLRAGRRLPPHLFPHLFETSREYELAYAGKARKADVLAETMAIPLQPVKTFGDSSDGWSNMLILGDNLQVLRRLLQMKEAGELRNADGTDGVRVCYIDPPFATRREFQGSQGERAYLDRVEGAEFVEFLRRRLILIRELLSSDGTLYVHLDQRKAHYAKVILDEIFEEQNFLSEVIWSYGSASGGRAAGNKLVRGHETLLVYARRYGEQKFNRIFLPYSEKYIRDWFKWDDDDGRGSYRKRWRRDKTGVSKAEKQYLNESPGMPLSTVWDDIQQLYADPRAYKPEQAEHSEMTGYPTQKPQRLLERVIELSSNPGDIVLDAFVGSGTALAAAQTAPSGSRRWIGIDCGKYAIYTSQARLLRQAGKKSPKQSFTLYNAGLYDYGAVRDLPWPEYKAFALQLFQCRPMEEQVRGVPFDGFLGDARVLVYNFKDHKDAKIGESFVHDLATLCGEALGDRCFIIAPALAVEPYEDYLTVGGTRFFFLRIPYSIIAELHKRAFSELRQPTSEQLANATIDAVGFDFIMTPRVEASYEAAEESLAVTITQFESEAYSAKPSNGHAADLAMVMVDYDYDGEIFDLDAVHYAEDMAGASWCVEIPRSQVGKQIMLIYLDVYGNEHRETKTISDFDPAPMRNKKSTLKAQTVATQRKKEPQGGKTPPRRRPGRSDS